MKNDETDRVVRVFTQAIPEIAAGLIAIKAVAHKAGFFTKVAVQPVPPMDVVGVYRAMDCNVHRIANQLNEQKVINLCLWDESPEQLIKNALMPATIEKVILHPAQHRATVVVKKHQLAYVVGELESTSAVSGWEIDAVAE